LIYSIKLKLLGYNFIHIIIYNLVNFRFRKVGKLILQINGESKSYEDNTTLLEIMQLLKIEDKVMAAAVNMQIVKKDDWSNFKPQDNDKLELLHFVGGG